VSHIPRFGHASKPPVGDTASPTGDAASPSEDVVVSQWRCIISFRDVVVSPNCGIRDTAEDDMGIIHFKIKDG
jgi:hypothetical protein